MATSNNVFSVNVYAINQPNGYSGLPQHVSFPCAGTTFREVNPAAFVASAVNCYAMVLDRQGNWNYVQETYTALASLANA